MTTLWASLFTGSLGGDYFYRGHKFLAVIKLLSIGGFGIWYIYDIYNYLFELKEIDENEINEKDKFDKKTFIISLVIALAFTTFFYTALKVFHHNSQPTSQAFIISLDHGLKTFLMELYVVFFSYFIAIEIVIGILSFLTFTIIDSIRKKKHGWIFINVLSVLIGFIFINLYYYLYVRNIKTKRTI